MKTKPKNNSPVDRGCPKLLRFLWRCEIIITQEDGQIYDRSNGAIKQNLSSI